MHELFKTFLLTFGEHFEPIEILLLQCGCDSLTRPLCACVSLRSADFPLHLLPHCAPSGGFAGQTRSNWHGVPAGTPVGAALGDFQCSVYSCMRDQTDAGETGSSVLVSKG